MNRKYKNLLKDTFIFALGSLGSKLILFFLVPLYTNYLSTAEYGTADLVQSFSQIVIPFTALSINESLLRFGMKPSENKENVLKSSFFVLCFSCVFSFVICFLLRFYSAISDWWLYLFFLVLFSNITEIEKTYLKVKNMNFAFSTISIIQTLVLAIANILMLIIFHAGISGYLTASIVAMGIGAIATFFIADVPADLHSGLFDNRLLKEMVLFSLPLIFSNVSWWIIHSSDKIMIEIMIGTSALGLYTASTKIPSLINVITAIFNQAWGISSITEIESTKDYGFYSDVFSLFSVFVFGSAIFFTSIIKPLMSFYVGYAFRESWIFVPLLISAAVFFSIQAFIGSIYSALQKSMNNMLTTVLCAIINIIVNYIFIKLVGTWGAIIGTVTSYFFIANVRIIDIKRYIKFNFDLRHYVINVLLLFSHAICISINWHYIFVSIIILLLFTTNNFEEEKRIALFLKALIIKLAGKYKSA